MNQLPSYEEERLKKFQLDRELAKKSIEEIDRQIEEWKNAKRNKLIEERERLLKELNRESIEYHNKQKYLSSLCKEIDGENFKQLKEYQDEKYDNLKVYIYHKNVIFNKADILKIVDEEHRYAKESQREYYERDKDGYIHNYYVYFI